MKNRSGISGIVIIGIIVVVLVVVRRVLGGIPLLGSLIRIGGLALIIILAIVLAVMIIALVTSNRSGGNTAANENKAEPTPNDEQNRILRDARQELMTLRRAGMRIKNVEVRRGSEKVARSVERILTELRHQPDQIQSQRQFLGYYLPTITQVLRKYAHLEESGAMDETTAANAEKYLADVHTALERQYGNLFSKDKLDLTVEMEAMTLAAKREGLLDDSFTPHSAKKAEMPGPELTADPGMPEAPRLEQRTTGIPDLVLPGMEKEKEKV